MKEQYEILHETGASPFYVEAESTGEALFLSGFFCDVDDYEDYADFLEAEGLTESKWIEKCDIKNTDYTNDSVRITRFTQNGGFVREFGFYE